MAPGSDTSASRPERIGGPPKPDRLAGRHILVVDNDMATIVSRELIAAGCAAADIALDGEAALACLSRQSYDLIVLNYNMPRLSGVGVLRRIRSRGDRTPVIFVSAWSVDQIEETIDDLPYDDWIEKPFSMSLLLQRIAAALTRHGR